MPLAGIRQCPSPCRCQALGPGGQAHSAGENSDQSRPAAQLASQSAL